MLDSIIVHSLVVFAITLTITKSEIMACKRFFVEERFDFIKAQGGQPCFFHRWFHAIWTCPMCCGFWIALITSFFFSKHGIICGTLSAYSLNWLFHCCEEFLYNNSRNDNKF